MFFNFGPIWIVLDLVDNLKSSGEHFYSGKLYCCRVHVYEQDDRFVSSTERPVQLLDSEGASGVVRCSEGSARACSTSCGG